VGFQAETDVSWQRKNKPETGYRKMEQPRLLCFTSKFSVEIKFGKLLKKNTASDIYQFISKRIIIYWDHFNIRVDKFIFCN